jgi:adenylyl-sulfate kinase
MAATMRRAGFTVWLTGLPCSGKSTLAKLLEAWLQKRQYPTQLLDGDQLRAELSPDLGFSREDRARHNLRVAFVCRLLNRHGIVVIAALVSPHRDVRDRIRRSMEPDFAEVYVNCPLDVCVRRDVKGLYRKAMEGSLKGFTGIDDPYEAPGNPEVVLHTSREEPGQSLDALVKALSGKGFLHGPG